MKKSWVLIVVLCSLFFTASFVGTEFNDYRKGLRYYQKHQYRKAITHLMRYTEKTPDIRAYYLIGYASYKLKDYATAQRFFSDLYLIDPEFKASSVGMR